MPPRPVPQHRLPQTDPPNPASIFLPPRLFVSYRLSTPAAAAAAAASDPDDPSAKPPSHHFALSLQPLLSTLQILSTTSTPPAEPPRLTGPYASDAYSSSFAAHRLTRHSGGGGGGLFSPSLLGTSGHVRIVYRGPGSDLDLSVPSSAGVRTSSSLATYLPDDDDDDDDDDGDHGGGGGNDRENIPFDRSTVRVKAILPATVLGDAVAEISALGPPDVFAIRAGTTAPYLVLRGEGGQGGECTVAFGDDDDDDEEGGGLGGGRAAGRRSALLETFQCEGSGGGGRVVSGRFAMGTVRKAVNAMRAASKVSLRLDGQGVLSLQFMVEVAEGQGGGTGEEVAFVDFRVVPLWEEEEEEEEGE